MIYTRSVGITITRTIIGAILVKDFISYILFQNVFFGEKAIVPLKYYEKTLSIYNLTIFKLNFSDYRVTLTILLIGLVAAISFFLGIWRIISGLALFIILLELKFRNIYLLDGGDNVISTTLPFLLFCYSKPFLKVKATNWGYKINSIRRIIQILASKGLSVQFAFVYLFAAVDKIMSPVWREGVALYYSLRLNEFRISSLNIWLTENAFFVKTLTYSTIVWETLFPLLIWFNKTKRILVIISICMHLGILVLMRIDNYSIIMIAYYPIYFTNDEIKWFTNKLHDAFVIKNNHRFRSIFIKNEVNV